MKEKIEKIKELVTSLNKHRDSYYNKQNPTISDYEYDLLFDKLERLEKETGFILANSPTQTVGYEVKSELKKVVHNHPMLSLDKTKSEEDLIKFLGKENGLAMLKMDGLTISLTYKNGELVAAETRGNGEIGEDVFHNVKMFDNVPLKIDYYDELIVDGEAIITYDDFEKINKPLVEKATLEAIGKGLKDKELDEYIKEHSYKNPRNLASGSVRQLDNSITKNRNVKFIAWKVVKGNTNNNFISRLRFLEELGFTVVSFEAIYENSIQEISNVIRDLKRNAELYKYPIDGIVISFNDIAYGESLGATGHHLKSQIAFKFYDEVVETKLLNIEWTIGKTGVLTPTAVFEPVEIDGTTVSRASVHNISILEKLELCEGDIVEVYKANMIIPQIRRNISKEERNKKVNEEEIGYIYIPTTCPICGKDTELITENNSTILKCTNSKCKGKLLGKLTHFVSKNAMNIDGLSEATLQKFIDEGFVESFIDIYELKAGFYDDIIQLDGFGKKSVDKLMDAIEKSKHTTLDRFIYALSIPLIGKSASKTISKHFNGDFEKFYNEGLYGASFNWTQLEDFGETMEESINRYTYDENPSEIWELGMYMTFQKPKQNNDSFKKIDGKTFVITGSLNKFSNRDKATEAIENFGGKVVGSVSKKTDYLVNNDINSTSGKNKKAKELGIPIIDEETLLSMLDMYL